MIIECELPMLEVWVLVSYGWWVAAAEVAAQPGVNEEIVYADKNLIWLSNSDNMAAMEELTHATCIEFRVQHPFNECHCVSENLCIIIISQIWHIIEYC